MVDPVSPEYISLYFRAENDTPHQAGVGFGLASAGGAGWIAFINYHAGYLRWERGSYDYPAIVSASTATWYLIELRNIDWASHTFDIWVDSVRRVVGVPFIANVSSFQNFYNYACNYYYPYGYGPVYIDDLKYGWNEAPMVAASAAAIAVDEGQQATISGTMSDPDGDEVTLAASVGSVVDNGDGTWSWSLDAVDGPADSQTVTVSAGDPYGASSETSFALAVQNAAPTVGSVTAPVTLAPVNTPVNVSASFTDPGVLDTHTASWQWGGGASAAGTLVETDGSGTVTGSHVYSEAGVYTVTLAVSDADGGTGTSPPYEYAVVYDPAGGFVTGGGWIASPAGAYAADPSLAGKATFGFVSKYKKGASVPTGSTEFQFNAGDLNFHSDVQDWLVVNKAGTNAQFKGTGTVNGAGTYRFMIWATDDGASGDAFRIRIWREENGVEEVVYDSGVQQSIGGGQIVIHTK